MINMNFISRHNKFLIKVSHDHVNKGYEFFIFKTLRDAKKEDLKKKKKNLSDKLSLYF